MIKKNSKRGFTLVEIIVSICIMAVMAAVMVPSLINLSLESRRDADETKFTSMCTAFKSALAEPAVQKEMDKLGGADIKVVFRIDENGFVDFGQGELIGTATMEMANASLWLNSYQTIGINYEVEYPEHCNQYLVFEITPKTPKTTARCEYKIVESHP